MMASRRTADIVLLIVAAMAVFLMAIIVYASSHGPIPTRIEPCAVVLERGNQQVCR